MILSHRGDIFAKKVADSLQLNLSLILNLIKFIKQDMKTFLIAIHGSVLNPAKKSLPIWRETAKLVFKNLENHKVVSENGMYDKLIMECAFRRNLLKRGDFDNEG